MGFKNKRLGARLVGFPFVGLGGATSAATNAPPTRRKKRTCMSLEPPLIETTGTPAGSFVAPNRWYSRPIAGCSITGDAAWGDEIVTSRVTQ